MSLAERLRERIGSKGPITFHDWMEACLYDPVEGYYMRPGRKTGAGDDADFATSPTLHSFMGTSVGKEIQQAWQRAGEPSLFDVWEFGGGEGHLARHASEYLTQQAIPVTWHHIERSPSHRAAQAGSGQAVTEMPPGAGGFVVAHEFLDALPFHWLERGADGWQEVCFEGQEVLRPAGHDATSLPRGDWEVGRRLPAMVGVRDWFAGLRDFHGEILIVDYGAEGRKLWDRDPKDGTVRTFANHQDGGSPYESPGSKDITASIDFAQTRGWAEAAGHTQSSLQTQQEWLVDHGALEAMNAIDRNSLEGASTYLRLRQMVIGHAGGMGEAFMVQRFERAS